MGKQTCTLCWTSFSDAKVKMVKMVKKGFFDGSSLKVEKFFEISEGKVNVVKERKKNGD